MVVRSLDSMPGHGKAVWPGPAAQYPSLHEFLAQQHRQLGGVISVEIGGRLAVSVASPAGLRESRELFDRPLSMLEALRPFYTAHSIAYANGEEAKLRRREYLNPPFTFEAVRLMLPTFVDAGERLVREWQRSGLAPFDLHRSTTQIALESFVAAALGVPWEQMKRLRGFSEAHLRQC